MKKNNAIREQVMWVIFGWQKIETPLGEVGSAHCYDCQRETRWEVWNVGEWVTFCAIKIVRFIHKHEIQCASCSTMLALRAAEFEEIVRHMRSTGTIDGTHVHARLAARIEYQQLSHKTPTQMKFIKESLQAKKECEARMAASRDSG